MLDCLHLRFQKSLMLLEVLLISLLLGLPIFRRREERGVFVVVLVLLDFVGLVLGYLR